MFGQLLRRLREERGLRLITIAQAIGVREATVSQWERSVGITPTPARVRQLAEALGLPGNEQTDLLRLAHVARGEVAIPTGDLSVDAILGLTLLEEAAIAGRLSPQIGMALTRLVTGESAHDRVAKPRR